MKIAAPAMMPKLLGSIGSYRLEAVLGQGGMGEVFLARDENLQRQVAIKRIRTDLPVDARQRARFRREALAVARLNHPAIVQVHELLETPDGDCLVMERVEGRSLAEHIVAGEIDLRLALRLAIEIAEGLAEAHTKGMIHRDLKPENVLVTATGHAKIVDFGLARMLWDDDDDRSGSCSQLTEAGMLVGTVHAMSPEQASGREVDHRSDLFALGTLLYQMLSGRAPFRGENWLDSLRRVNAEEPTPLEVLRPELPSALVALVKRLLSKEKEDRPANARLVVEALEQIQHGTGEASLPLFPMRQPASARALPADLLEDSPTGEWPVEESQRGERVLRSLLLVERLDPKGSGARLDEALRLEACTRELRRLRDLVAEHDGIEVEKGSALLALFERPADAVACALAHQRALIELSSALGMPLTARMAVHLGEVFLLRPGPQEVSRGARPLEVEGSSKQVVALLASLAEPGQILLTQGAFDLARRSAGYPLSDSRIRRDPNDPVGDAFEASGSGPEDGSLRWLAHGAYVITSAEEAIEIFEVGHLGTAPLKAPADSPQARRRLSPSEERLLGWRPAAGQPIPLRPHWTLGERLGEGGFGEVWLARHKAGERRVFKFCFEADRLRTLKREVTLFRLLKEALGHRSDIARILDWQFDEPPYFIESEHTEGGNLVSWAEGKGGLVSVPLVTRLELVAEVAEALAAAHSVGVLHKDVKPENVLVEEDREGRPRARLTDFGIGHLTERERLGANGVTALGFTQTLGTTESGQGTWGYMAPELLEGKAPSIQADIYSLGVMLYQLALGDFKRVLAPGWERDIGDEILAEDLAEFVDGRPERRPGSAREVAERLRTLDARRAARMAAAANGLASLRAQKRRNLVSAAAAISLVVLVIVAVMGLREYRARQIAEAAEKRASLRQRQAEDLIGFMLGDLRKKLDGVGRLDVLDAVGEQAMNYFAAVPARELSDEELARRTRALHQIGQVRVSQGQLPQARLAFAEAASLGEALVARQPDCEEWHFELAQSLFGLGQVDWNQGDLVSALARFHSYLRIAEGRLALDGESSKWQMEVAYASTNVALVLQAMGRLAEAESELARSIAIKRSRHELEPGNLEWLTSLANGLAWLAFLQSLNGNLERSVETFLEEKELRLDLLTRDPKNPQAQFQLATCLTNLGERWLERGEVERAVRELTRALELHRGMARIDLSNRDWQDDLACALREYGEAAFWFGNPHAMVYLEEAEVILEKLIQTDPSNRKWQDFLAETFVIQAEIDLRQERIQRAITRSQNALSLVESVVRKDSANQKLRGLSGRAGLVLGLALLQQGQVSAAQAAWSAAAGALEPERDAKAPRIGDVRAQILFFLGREKEANEVIGRLQAGGYAHPNFKDFIERRLRLK